MYKKDNRVGTCFQRWFLAASLLTTVFWFGNVVAADPGLEVLRIDYEPIRQGSNVLHVQVHNRTNQDRVLWTHIYTRSPDLSRGGIGWGKGFPEIIKANYAQRASFAYNIQGPVTGNTLLQITCYDAGTAADFSQETRREKQQPLKEMKRVGQELARAMTSPEREAPAELSRDILRIFEQLQEYMRGGQYGKLWERFTLNYQRSEFQGSDVDCLLRVMEPQNAIDTVFHWEKSAFLRLESFQVKASGENAILRATDPVTQEVWTIEFVQSKGQWRINNIIGYCMPCQRWDDWDDRLLPRLQKLETEHFLIYCYPGSTAAQDAQRIVQQREHAIAQIGSFLSVQMPGRIRLVFFETRDVKLLETGHQGMGWAEGRTVVEVYNRNEQLDPFHEMTHILASALGHPPALFREGLAVYMSERLGAAALEDLGGGVQTIDQRARELHENGTWIDLQELITYSEIGSQDSRPLIAYAEAASFVKFLIETHGREQFLETYTRLKNANNKDICQQNLQFLTDRYGVSLEGLQRQWLHRILSTQP